MASEIRARGCRLLRGLTATAQTVGTRLGWLCLMQLVQRLVTPQRDIVHYMRQMDALRGPSQGQGIPEWRLT